MAYDISVPFSFKKSGIFYFERRVPRDLRRHYSSGKIAYSLRTRSAGVASSRAIKAAQQLDEYWYHLRLQIRDLPGKHLLRLAPSPDVSVVPAPDVPKQTSVSLSEAVSIYLRLKGQGKTITFVRAAERACGYVIDACGDRDLLDYTKKDATKFRDALVERGLSGSSITRIFGTVRSVINFATSELGVDHSNPFSGVYYDREQGVQQRATLPPEVLASVQSMCRSLDDDLRWLVALVSDTGMRLAEAAGLSKDDIVLDQSVPHIRITEHPWRRLKTKSSNRLVPLVGMSLWAAERIMEQPDEGVFAFSRYNRTDQTNANSASAALNKWLKPMVPERCTMHSFRHSLRDRLRAVECPSDIVDQLGGWQTEGVGHGYGQGYPLEVLHRWMGKLSNPCQN